MIKVKCNYDIILSQIFENHYRDGLTEFKWERKEIIEVCDALNMEYPGNLGDVPYTYRYRNDGPSGKKSFKKITDTAPDGFEWIIVGDGKSKYKFILSSVRSNIIPRNDLFTIKLPDATPEIISKYSLSDEQALLAKLRYNRLIDTFLQITAYSLQNHLRSHVKSIGQIEIDEIYVGVDKRGVQYIVPVQAKGNKDVLGITQSLQDLAYCQEKYPTLMPRLVSAQFMDTQTVAMFELILDGDEMKVIDEKHYKLVPASEISDADLITYNRGLHY